MVAGVSFVAGQVNGSFDINGKIGIELNKAVTIALEIVVARPWFIVYIFNPEAFVGW